MKSTSW